MSVGRALALVGRLAGDYCTGKGTLHSGRWLFFEPSAGSSRSGGEAVEDISARIESSAWRVESRDRRVKGGDGVDLASMEDGVDNTYRSKWISVKAEPMDPMIQTHLPARPGRSIVGLDCVGGKSFNIKVVPSAAAGRRRRRPSRLFLCGNYTVCRTVCGSFDALSTLEEVCRQSNCLCWPDGWSLLAVGDHGPRIGHPVADDISPLSDHETNMC
jgi:hypothetical protein